MARARSNRVVEEEHENHERWLITYADMITLLMVLFIVLFAISQVDVQRFERLRDGMAVGFGDASPFQGSSGVLPEDGPRPIAAVDPSHEEDGPVTDAFEQPSRSAEEDARDRYALAAAEVHRLEQLRSEIEKALERRDLLGDVRMRIDSRGLTVSLVSRHIVFAPDMADLTSRGRRVLDVLGPLLRGIDNRIDVDGHTNQVKVQPKYYATDWDLSAARAVTVLRYLDERQGIAGSRLSAVAYGHERPLIDPADPRSQVLNKRVDVVVVSGADEATRALFDDVLADRNSL